MDSGPVIADQCFTPTTVLSVTSSAELRGERKQKETIFPAVNVHPAPSKLFIAQVKRHRTPDSAQLSPSAQCFSLAGHFAESDELSQPWTITLAESLTQVLARICDLNQQIAGRARFPGGPAQPLPQTPPYVAEYASKQYPDGTASVFYSLVAPEIGLQAYVFRLVQYLHVSRSVFISALVLLDRAQAADDALALSPLNVHRLLTAAITVATKFLEDETYRNSTIARVAGIPSTAEMNHLEKQFLRRISWNASVDFDTYFLYDQNVFARS